MEEAKLQQCRKVVFVLLDHLDRWVREWKYKDVSGQNAQYDKIKVSVFMYVEN